MVRSFIIALIVLAPLSALAAAPEAPHDITPRPAWLAAHPDAVAIALRCACQTHPDAERCADERRDEVTETVADLLWVVEQRSDVVPEAVRPILVAVACGESGYRSHPTCGGHGGCNDSGTSAGMFQIKRRGGLARLYERTWGTSLDPHDHLTAGLYYVDRLIHGAAQLVPRACGKKRELDRWNVAAWRLGRGPMLSPRRPERRICAPTTTGEELCRVEPASPGVPRCQPGSRYASWAAKWYREAPEAWHLVDRREADGGGSARGDKDPQVADSGRADSRYADTKASPAER